MHIKNSFSAVPNTVDDYLCKKLGLKKQLKGYDLIVNKLLSDSKLCSYLSSSIFIASSMVNKKKHNSCSRSKTPGVKLSRTAKSRFLKPQSRNRPKLNTSSGMRQSLNYSSCKCLFENVKILLSKF